MTSKASCPESGAKRKVKCDICFEFADRPHRCGKDCLGLFCEACLAAHFEHNSNCPCCRRRLVSIWRRNRSSLFDERLHEHIQSLIAGGASIDDVDEAEIKQRERAHAASQAKHGELKQEYEAMLETQRQLRKVEAEENERKLRKFLASDPEFCASNPSQSSSPSEMYLADQEADVVERLRREEEELRKRLEQEQKDAEFARKLADQLEGTSKRSHSSEEASTATGFASSSRKRSLHNTSNTSVSPRRTSAKHLRSPADKQGNLCGLNRAVREPLSGRRFLSSTQTMDNVSSPAPRKRMAREPSSPAIVDLVDLSSPTAEAVGGISTRPTSATGSKHPTQLSSLTLVRTLARNHRPADCFNKAVPGNTLHRFLRLSQSPPNPRTS
eukprot:INCI10791.1.p1 GENE.INCI10791.1~~INCI10791.1.p1  ORF type:complete len:385 (-),score=58.07 INCI10791.1:289-1443(-)